MKLNKVIMLLFCLVLVACVHSSSTPPITQATLVLTDGTLIDGTGADPVPNVLVAIGNQHILAVGHASQVYVPANAKVIDLNGAFILPGFINAHVHDAYDERRLEAWAQAGVTTVRDEGIISGYNQLERLLALRNQLAGMPEYARLVSSGYMITVPGGYGLLRVHSAEEACQEVSNELKAGVDVIKLTMEDGYGSATNLSLLSSDELSAIISTAHSQGILVSAHVTEAKFLQQVVDAGVDDTAHIPWDEIPQSLIQQMLNQDVYAITTLTVMDAYGLAEGASSNLSKLVEAGINIAMGNDYTCIPQNYFNHFELGMPMHEISLMSNAGMTPMQIIIASTRNAAHVCGLEHDLGTVEVGKLADILILNADPLQDLSALTQVKMVIHNGEIIRQ